MILTLILGALGGAATPFLLPHVTRIAQPLFAELQMPNEAALRVASFALALLAAAVLLNVAGDGASAFWLLIGGLMGHFHAEIRQAITDRMG